MPNLKEIDGVNLV